MSKESTFAVRSDLISPTSKIAVSNTGLENSLVHRDKLPYLHPHAQRLYLALHAAFGEDFNPVLFTQQENSSLGYPDQGDTVDLIHDPSSPFVSINITPEQVRFSLATIQPPSEMNISEQVVDVPSTKSSLADAVVLTDVLNRYKDSIDRYGITTVDGPTAQDLEEQARRNRLGQANASRSKAQRIKAEPFPHHKKTVTVGRSDGQPLLLSQTAYNGRHGDIMKIVFSPVSLFAQGEPVRLNGLVNYIMRPTE